MNIGPYRIDPPLILAPMAGVTDKPFRCLARRLGAGYAVSEMTASDPTLWGTVKSLKRMDHTGEQSPIGVQIAGSDPDMMAAAARFNVEAGAEIIDINMGCPAKKVCKLWAGSALLRDEQLVGRILSAVVRSVDVPVTLKIRTGYDSEHVNAVQIARIAEGEGVQALAVHGRTRDMHYKGDAEYQTIAAVKSAISIPVIANGDLTNPAKALEILKITGADALMIGRAAQGRPWVFHEMSHYLQHGVLLPEPSLRAVSEIMLGHVAALHDFYGEPAGVRIARKHLRWYVRDKPGSANYLDRALRAETAALQLQLTTEFFGRLESEEHAESRDAALGDVAMLGDVVGNSIWLAA
jgi:tRNA-dihydrouridine synthase B